MRLALPLALLIPTACQVPNALPPREPVGIVAHIDLQLDDEERAIAHLGHARLLRRIRRCVAVHGLPPLPPGRARSGSDPRAPGPR